MCRADDLLVTQVVFDPETARAHARKFSRPPLAGSRAEKQVAEEIRLQLESSGFSVNEQVFEFSTAFERVLAAEILSGILLILAALWISGINRWLTLIPVGLLLILLVLIGPLNRRVQRSSLDLGTGEEASFWSCLCWKFGTRFRTRNLVATLQETGDGADLAHLYLVAHYDSKSQNLPLAVRIGLFMLLTAGSLVFAALNVLNLLLGSLNGLIVAAGILVLVSGIPLLLLKTGDDSPGAIDNASGLGLVLRLAEMLASTPGLCEKMALTILITGGEELALNGSLAHVLLNETELEGQAAAGGLYVLNFDGVGIDSKLYLVGGSGQSQQSGLPILSRLVYQSAGESGISLGRFFLPGARFDHQPFMEGGYDALSVIAIGKDSLAIHTAGDSPDRLHPKGFDQAGCLAIRVIEKISGQSFN